MFVNEKLVFVELHKTGCTHIGKWLDRLVGGEQIGKHNRVPAELQSRFIIGSVRNPWDWYVSLWAYGCSKRGAVYHTTTRNLDIPYLWSELGPDLGRNIPNGYHFTRQAWADLRRPTSRWVDVYRDPTDVGAFREWLRMMMDPKHRFDVAEGYGFSPCSNWAGLMSFRYLKLFGSMDNELFSGNDFATKEAAEYSWLKYKLPRSIIRTEELEMDLLRALAEAGFAISQGDRQALLNASKKKTNTSSRMSAELYYDSVSIDLVAERDALIIKEHEYSPPT